jgi:2-polyprenyl-3-methyl-5-hydroxy-6-metoxy-1,4-benzoquinol methylase
MLENFDCPICTQASKEVYLRETLNDQHVVFGYKWSIEVRKHYQYLRCNNCSHVWASPRHSNLYDQYIDTEDEVYLLNEELRMNTAEKVIRVLQKYLNKNENNSLKLLDVGCSTGDFLQVAKKYFEVEGIELSTWAIDIAKSRDIKIWTTNAEDINLPKNSFDVITLWGVIEHLENPYRVLSNLAKSGTQNSIIAVWTGNVDSISSRIFKGNWWYVMGQHIQLFSQNSMDKLFEAIGYKRLAKKTYPYVITFQYLGSSMKRYPKMKIFSKLFQTKLFRKLKFTLYLPGEMFTIYQKNESSY